jgi:hypothetical protein
MASSCALKRLLVEEKDRRCGSCPSGQHAALAAEETGDHHADDAEG